MKRLLAAFVIVLTAACAPIRQTEPASSSVVRPVVETPPAISVVVDKSDRMLMVYRGDQLLRTYTGLAFGDERMGHKRFQGDERTPEGRYTIDTRNPNSAYHLSLRISYPNQKDRIYAAGQGRDPGGDIFIHGQPSARARLDANARIAGDWTDGCIAVSNSEMQELWVLIPDGTAIEIRQ